MSAILDALLKLAGGDKLLPPNDLPGRTLTAPQDRVMTFTGSARATTTSDSVPRTASSKLARSQVERKPSSRASVPPTITEALRASSEDQDRPGDNQAAPVTRALALTSQTASSQPNTPVNRSAASTATPTTSPSSTLVASADTSMTAETSFYTASDLSSPDQIDLGPQSLPFVLQRRALAGVSGDSQTPSKPPTELPLVVRKPIKIESPGRSENRKPPSAAPASDKMDVDPPLPPVAKEAKEVTSARVTEAVIRKPPMSRWREEQLARRPFPRVINMTPRNIPILHGPPSLPYGRNPSGVDAPSLDDKEYLIHMAQLEEDPVALISVPYFSPAPKKVVVIRNPVQPPIDKDIVGFKNEGNAERSAQKDRPELPPSSILRAHIRNKLAGEGGRRNYTHQQEEHSAKTEDDASDDDDQLSESFFKLTTEPKEGIYAPPAKQQGFKRPRSNTASSKADIADNWRARDPQPEASTVPPVMTIDELMARFHNDGASKATITVKAPAPSVAELKKIDGNVTPSKQTTSTARSNDKLKTLPTAPLPKQRGAVQEDKTLEHKDNENDPDSSDKIATKAKGTPNAGRLLKRQRVSSRSSLSKTTPPRA